MDKKILEDYIDACENIKDIEKNIQRLKKRKKTVIQTSVSGSNPNFPYEKTHFKVQGVLFTYSDENRLKIEEAILEEGKAKAEELKLQVEQWMNTIPNRMQRIIRYGIFEGMSWEQVADRLGRKATGESVRKEYERFMEK
jgi:DNA-directed RNA polymerase specialized sigma24 family protein